MQKAIVPADQIPPATPLGPEEALKSFTVAPGFTLEIAACEPLIQDPVAIAFGSDGRLWVVEMRGYMPDLDGSGEDEPIGRVVVLSDRDQDGRYDDSRIFVDGLVLPRAILLVADGVLIGAPPELAFWRDTNGDGQADEKTIVAADYGVKVDPQRPYLGNPERAPNSLLWACDNWIYSAAYTKKFRYTPDGWKTAGTDFRGQWGLSQDDLGRLFYNSNSDHLRVDVVPSEFLRRNRNFPALAGANVNAASDQFVWPARVTPGLNRGYRAEMLRQNRLKEFTAASAIWIYRGDLLPSLYGNAFVGEPSGNLVRRSILINELGTVHGRNAYTGREFIASTDERFRPVNFATGPDGALYIVDFHRGVIQHRVQLTSYLRAQSESRGLVEPRHLGRIYRVVPADKPVTRATRLAELSTLQWVERLSHPNAWWRETAQRILVERREPAATPALRRMVKSNPQPRGRAHALWTLEGVGALDRSTLLTALDDGDLGVRTAAIRLAEPFLFGADRASLVSRLLALTADEHPEVQIQAVLTLGAVGEPAVDRSLANTARTHPRNLFLRDALYSGLEGREVSLLEQLVKDTTWMRDVRGNTILSGLAQGVFASRDLSAIERLVGLIAAEATRDRVRGAALLDGAVAAASALRRPVQFSQPPSGWNKLARIPAFQLQLATLDRIVRWPGKSDGEGAASHEPLTSEQERRFDTGRALYTTACAGCHQSDGHGLDGLAPPLLDSEWVLGPPARLIRILLHGVRGPITVSGRMHTGDMPAFGAVDDLQISAVLTYVRREWGHTASPIDPGSVKTIRAATKGQSDAWSARELMRFK